ncbi:sulfotransferase domain-containing protein [Corallococcus interemptor]|uniref:sulfotransferase domain-containing protein n=1 Tax=Corallococcus interemptor TaxID=2316720 RepID=UPI0035D40880
MNIAKPRASRTGPGWRLRLKYQWAGLRGVYAWFRARYVLLKPLPGDIYVATAAKAGTTWMQQIVFQLLHEGRGEFEHIQDVSPFLDTLGTKPEGRALLAALPSPRIIKTHQNHALLRPPASSRILYVTRAASDSLLSYYHQQVLRQGGSQDFAQYLQGALRHNGWSSHLRSWWPHRQDPNVLHVRYADLVANRERECRRIATFLGLRLEDAWLPSILEKTSFDYMKRNTHRFDPLRGRPERGSFIREGKVGSGQGALDPEHQALLEQALAPLYRELGIQGGEV